VPPSFHAGSVTYGPVLNAAAVLLSCCGNVPAERSAQLIGMLTGEDVSSGWVDKAVARVNASSRQANPTRPASMAPRSGETREIL
jgi:hypothetical protein